MNYEEERQQKANKTEKDSKNRSKVVTSSKKNMIILFVMLTIIILFLIFNLSSNKTKIAKCSYNSYGTYDQEYIITSKNGKIKNINFEYVYYGTHMGSDTIDHAKTRNVEINAIENIKAKLDTADPIPENLSKTNYLYKHSLEIEVAGKKILTDYDIEILSEFSGLDLFEPEKGKEFWKLVYEDSDIDKVTNFLETKARNSFICTYE